LGLAQKAQGRDAAAESSYRHAIALDRADSKPRASYNLANLLLQNGRWREGFAAYEWRLKLPGAPAAPWSLPDWNPALPKGSRVLLWNDQGLGDGIMYLRFARLLAERGYKPFVFAQAALKPLAATVAGVESVFDPNDAPAPMDAALPLCSLPHALGLEAVDVWTGPYVRAPVQGPVKLEGRSKRAGLVWAGNAAHDNDANRSMPLDALATLFAVPGFDWFSLQLGPRASELQSSPFNVRDLSVHLSDLSASAAILSQLDVLVTVDTAPAHLAGALGRRVCTLLPAIGTDWRWGREGPATFWYPSMRLYRQDRAGDWSGPVSALANDLRAA
ncbi:MAG: hypothetical protein JO254_05380, partial [Pseudolabrys sp.]|nr:hypothetical protein [Pseudolabrys sp.]